MSTSENTSKSTPSNNSSEKKLKIIIVILAIACTVMGVLLFNSGREIGIQGTEILQLENTALTLKSDLQDMLIQYDTLTVTNEKMQNEIMGQRSQIEELLKQVEKHKDDAWIIHKLKKEASTLRQVMRGYLVTIDSLNTLNVHLKEDNQLLNKELTKVTSQKEELASKTANLEGIITKGSVLPALNVTAGAIRVRGSGKQIETNRADKAEMIKLCCTIGENKIAQHGKKVLYLRIISPDGEVLDDGTGSPKTFTFDKVSGKYSVKRDIDYDGQPQEVCVYYSVNSALSTGQYILELYEAESKIAVAKFDLK
jgi:hypothetical protein